MITSITATQFATLTITTIGGIFSSGSIDLPTQVCQTWTVQVVQTWAIEDINLVTMGDSNTLGYQVSSEKKYPNRLASNSGITVENLGVSGYQVTDLQAQVPNLSSKKIATKRNVVTVMIGVNDFVLGKSVSLANSQLQTLITDLKSGWWEVFVITYPPKTGDTVINTKIVEFDNLIKSWTWYVVIDAYSEFTDGANWNQTWLMQADWVHLNSLGNTLIYTLVYSSLQKPFTPTPNVIPQVPQVNTYATFSTTDKSNNIALSNWNLTATIGTPLWGSIRSNIGKSSGKWYWEYKITTVGGWPTIGIGNSVWALGNYVGVDTNSWSYYAPWKFITNWVQTGTPASFTTWDVIWVAYDATVGQVTFYKNWVSQWVPYSGITGTMYPMVGMIWNVLVSVTANFWATPFSYTPPAGFNPWLYY